MTTIEYCLTKFSSDIRGEMSPADAKALSNEIQSKAEARKAESDYNMTQEEAYRSVGKEIVGKQEKELTQLQYNALENVRKSVVNRDYLSNFPNQAKGAWSLLGGRQTNVYKSRFSYVANAHAEEVGRVSQLFSDLEKVPGSLEYFSDHKNSNTIIKEMEFRGSTKDPLAKYVAESWMDKHQPWLTKDLQEAGAKIFERPDYIARQFGKSSKIGSATGSELKDIALKAKLLIEHKGNYAEVMKDFNEQSFKRWVEVAKVHTDPETWIKNGIDPANTNAVEEFYREYHKGMVTGVHKRAYDSHISPSGKINYARKLEHSRALILKKGSWAEYNTQFGYDNIYSAIHSQLTQGSKDLTTLRMFGTYPEEALKDIVKVAREQSAGMHGSQKELRNTEALIDNIFADKDKPMSGLGGSIIKAFRQYSYITGTGSVTLTSFDDIPRMAAMAKANGIPYLKGYEEILGGLLKGRAKGFEKEVALQLGCYSEGAIGTLIDRFAPGDTAAGIMTRTMRLQDQGSLINVWDSVHRKTAGMMLSRNLAKDMNIAFTSLDPELQRALNISGISEKRWNVIRRYKSSVLEDGGRKFLTPSLVNDIADEVIVNELIGTELGQPSRAKINRERLDLKRSLDVYFMDQTSSGKIIPDISDMTLIRGRFNNESPVGVVMSCISQFKGFRVGATRKLQGRFLFGNGADNLYEAFFNKGTRGNLKGLINHQIQLLPYGYLSHAAKMLVAGRGLPNLNDTDTWVEVLSRSGVFGIQGDMLFDFLLGHHDIERSLLGPTLGNGIDILKGFREIISGEGKPGLRFTNLAIHNTPLAGMWWLKPWLDYGLFNALREKSDPGYLERKEQRFEKKGQGFLWNPTSSLGVG